jgi:inner membrane protein
MVWPNECYCEADLASIFTHTIVGVTLSHAIPAESRKDWRFWAAVVVCSMLPDVDVLGFGMGVRYADLWGHRGMTHSLLFAAVVSCCITLAIEPQWRLRSRVAALLFLVTASHGILDAMTDGGLGVAFFSPFDETRYFFPWRPIHVSPIGVDRFFSERGLRVLGSEILWIWIPSLVVLLGMWVWRQIRKTNQSHSASA